jgi:hypothetical protein
VRGVLRAHMAAECGGMLRRRESLAGSRGEHTGAREPQPAAEEAAMLVAAHAPHRRARPSRPSKPMPKLLASRSRAERWSTERSWH